jgi:hypothetical protein
MRAPDPTCIHANFEPPIEDKTAPVPLVFRRVREGEEPNIWADPVMGTVATSPEQVEAWIRRRSPEHRAEQDRLGREVQDRKRRRRDAADLIAATPVPAVLWSEPMWLDERWYDSLQDWLDEVEGEVPAWIWATSLDHWKLNVNSTMEQIAERCDEECGLEDAASDRLVGWPALEAALKEFAEANVIDLYNEDRSRVIVLDQTRYEAALVEARKLIGGME